MKILNNIKLTASVLTVCLAMSACVGPAVADRQASANTEANRAVVTNFVELFYHQKNVRLAFNTYVSEQYIQHNPGIADGRDAAIRALEPKFGDPAFTVDVKRILVDGDFAVVHLHARSSPDARGGAVVDMFRLQDGKVVEHWDVLQAIPETSANTHPMF